MNKTRAPGHQAGKSGPTRTQKLNGLKNKKRRVVRASTSGPITYRTLPLDIEITESSVSGKREKTTNMYYLDVEITD